LPVLYFVIAPVHCALYHLLHALHTPCLHHAYGRNLVSFVPVRRRWCWV